MEQSIPQQTISLFRRPLVQQITGDSKSTIYRKIKAGLLTKPVKISTNSVAWPKSEIEAINKARIAGKSEDEIKQALARVALQSSAWHKNLSNYSKGMRQKTAITLALLRSAPVLFLDEPTSGLDPNAIDEFNQLITSLALEGSTVFMVTHDVYGACQVAHRIGLLDNGKIVGMFERRNNTHIDTEEVHAAFSARN